MQYLALTLILGYIIGMFQTGFFVGKYYGIDIREFGSKNAGMTNVNRTLGKLPALVVFVVDVLKAIFAFLVVPMIFANSSWDIVLPLIAGLGAILGHNFPFYLKFKGGKGIACTLGIILMFDWQVALIAFGVGVVLVIAFRYISLASLAITLVWPILLLVFGNGADVVVISALISSLAWFMHRENIKRLVTKSERKFALGK